MKSLLLILSIAVAFSANANADNKKELSLTILKKLNFSETAKTGGLAMFEPMFANLIAQGITEAGVGQIRAAAENYLARVYLDEGLLKEMAGTYSDTYTEEELKELVEFYETPPIEEPAPAE